MTPERTQYQDDQQLRKSQELSRQRSHPPKEISGYEARQFLGAGAYGEVWVALDQNTGRKVAIKFYTQKSGVDWSLLSREVEKLVFLSADRYVVQLLDVGWDSDPPYYVMEYVGGGSLQQVLDREGQLAVGEAVEMFREIATGLLHAHGKGVLHCDLKPANILLDQDRKPRLADFGQSRLSHEQTPALGTLFFMAPEQADLTAVPDARWDVYALGALLHCMLTGVAPYRSDGLLSEIDSSPSLVGRLEKYRHAIQNLPTPDAHRRLRHVDRELADIIDRCLAVDPELRFPNVQSVLTAIRNRDQVKDRKPLLMLGLLGPLLFLLVLGFFGGRAYRASVQESDQMVRKGTYESSRFAAKYVSEAVARRIDQYFRLVENQANDETLQEAILPITDGELGELSRQLVDDGLDDAERAQSRARFIGHPLQLELQQRTDQLIADSKDSVASWFITDARGLQLASSFAGEPDRSTVGFDFSRRTYFHGGKEDFQQGRHYDLPPLSETQLSTVFRSEATGTWKVAVSTPIIAGGRPVGVVALTVELGHLGDEKEFAAVDGRFITLVDGRDGARRGQILQHPLFNEILERQAQEAPDETPKLPDYFSEPKYRVPIDELPQSDDVVRKEDVQLYRDPLAQAPGGSAYGQNWIAAREAVRLDAGNGATDALETGLIVLVQENYDLAALPVKSLGDRVLRDGFVALLLILSGVLFLWYLVTRAMRDPNETMRRSGVPVRPASLHSMETFEMPEKMRDRV